MICRYRSRPWLFLLAAALGLPAQTAAQTVRGSVVDEGTGEPLVGAFIVLVDGEGQRHEGVLTNTDGRFVLLASRPGTYRLVAELIGYASTESGWLDLAAGSVETYAMEVPVQAVSLAGIAVRSESRCRPQPGSGPGTAELWEEARKALEVTRWGEQEDALNMRIVQYSRELSPNAHSVREASQQSRTGYFDQSPYVSRPAEELDRLGYIRAVGENEYDYFAPDAGVLLSETFLSNHCFRIVEASGEDEGLVGLGFEPVRGRDVPDIEGTLWLDQGTAELRRLDFRYTELPFRGVTSDEAGGRVEFERLGNGMWIVDRWRLRMPLVALQQQPGWRSAQPKLEVVALNEIGAEVQRVVDLDGNVLAQAEAATLYGEVWDSVAGEPLANATVTLEGTERRTNTSVDGTYRFNDLEAGTYTVTFSHPAVEVLGLEPTPRRVAVESGRAARLPLAVPDGRRIAEAVCAQEDGPRSFVYGRVMDAGLTWPVSGAVVRLDPGAGEPRTTTADDSGVFQFCVAPRPDPVRVTAFRPSDAVRALSASAGDQVASAGLEVAAAEATTIRADLTVDAPEARVTATWSNVIRGTVVTEGGGDPLPGAAVTMTDTMGRPITTVVSNDDGAFQLPHPGQGTRFRLQAEHIGYADVTGAVDFGTRDELAVELVMATRAIELEPIVVVERRRDFLADMGYYFRKERGLGHFIERTDIERHRPADLTDIVRRTPGVSVQGLGMSRDILMVGAFRAGGWEERTIMGGSGTGGRDCNPAVFLDGALARPGGTESRQYTPFNQIVDPDMVEAIEVYRRATEVPARFSGEWATCGVIAVWTTR